LLAVNSIQSLVDKEANCSPNVKIGRQLLGERQIIGQVQEEAGQVEKKTDQGHQVRRHPHWQELHALVPVRGQSVVSRRVLS